MNTNTTPTVQFNRRTRSWMMTEKTINGPAGIIERIVLSTGMKPKTKPIEKPKEAQ